ncbi:hypothetical protein ACFSBZ_02590 [Amnibacterium flavum]|uniref:Glutaminase n=1 Tax=Amnibacterium flavum TaxID=2173173 RepID=A0A2V1HQF7_9MICO|nr:hypothetical protein [Amnibacterium flavum]PVZ94581.1 hypothetical protein DDQ50_12855 [Amnibacterium flavum]
MVDEVEADLAELLQRTIAALEASGAHDEALGEYRRKKGLLGLGGSVVLVPVGRAWRVGRLLLTRDGRIFDVGTTTRAVDPRHPNYQSVSGEDRRDDRRAAFEGDFAEGEVVNHDFTPIAVDAQALSAGSGPLSVQDGRLVIEWAKGQKAVPLAGYLVERVALLRKRDGWDEPDMAG